MRNHKWTAAFVALLLALLLTLGACSGGGTQSAGEDWAAASNGENQDAGGVVSEGSESAAAGSDAEARATSAQDQRKIVYSASYNIETTEFDKDWAAIQAEIEALGGYIQNSSVDGKAPKQRDDALRTATVTAKIPVENYEKFLKTADDTGKVVLKEQSGEDITAQYFDTDAYVKSLRTQLERLEAILTDAQKLSDIIELEKEIARVRLEIEENTTVLQQYDNLVSYATVDISLYEVAELTEVLPADQDLGTRIKNAFYSTINGLVTFLEGFVVVLIAALPVLALLGVIAVAVVLIVRAVRKRRTKRKNAVAVKAADETRKENGGPEE